MLHAYQRRLGLNLFSVFQLCDDLDAEETCHKGNVQMTGPD